MGHAGAMQPPAVLAGCCPGVSPCWQQPTVHSKSCRKMCHQCQSLTQPEVQLAAAARSAAQQFQCVICCVHYSADVKPDSAAVVITTEYWTVSNSLPSTTAVTQSDSPLLRSPTTLSSNKCSCIRSSGSASCSMVMPWALLDHHG
jgi:hypothetical protein